MSDLLEQMCYDSDFINYIKDFNGCSYKEHCHNSFLRFLLYDNDIKENHWFNDFYNNFYDEQTRANPKHKELIGLYIYTLEHFLDESLTYDPYNIKNYYFY